MDLEESWKQANQRLSELADHISDSTAHPPHVALGYLTAIAEQLRVTGDLLRQTQSISGEHPELPEALTHYRDCLKRLQEVLPALQSQILAQRSQLDPERAHLQAAAAWAQCTRNTTE